MSLLTDLNEDMKEAMRSKDKITLSVIRMIKASLQNEAINRGLEELTAEDELTILSRELKQRTASLQEFKAAGREDLSDKLSEEIDIIQQYMPDQLSEEALEVIVTETITEVQATSTKDFGKVMGRIMPKIKGKADGSMVKKLVQKHLV